MSSWEQYRPLVAAWVLFCAAGVLMQGLVFDLGRWLFASLLTALVLGLVGLILLGPPRR